MSSSIKPTQQRYDDRDYDTSFIDGVWKSLKTSTVLSFLLAIFISLIKGETYGLNTLGFFMGMFFISTLFSGVITLILTFTIAYPMTFILRYFNLLNDVNMALVAGLCAFSIVMLIPRDGFISFHYIIVFWGLACGYTFMQGYQRK